MANTFTPEVVGQFNEVDTALRDYMGDEITTVEIEIAPAVKAFMGAGLLSQDYDQARKKFNAQRIRYNRWAEQQPGGTGLMLNWMTVKKPGELPSLSYEGLQIVTVDQFYSDRTKERLVAVARYSENRAAELGAVVGKKLNGDDRGGNSPELSSEVKAVAKTIFQTAALNSKMHRMGAYGKLLEAIRSDEMALVTQLSDRLAAANSMLENAFEDGREPSMKDVLKITDVSAALDEVLALPDPSNGRDDD